MGRIQIQQKENGCSKGPVGSSSTGCSGMCKIRISGTTDFFKSSSFRTHACAPSGGLCNTSKVFLAGPSTTSFDVGKAKIRGHKWTTSLKSNNIRRTFWVKNDNYQSKLYKDLSLKSVAFHLPLSINLNNLNTLGRLKNCQPKIQPFNKQKKPSRIPTKCLDLPPPRIPVTMRMTFRFGTLNFLGSDRLGVKTDSI